MSNIGNTTNYIAPHQHLPDLAIAADAEKNVLQSIRQQPTACQWSRALLLPDRLGVELCRAAAILAYADSNRCRRALQ